MLHPSSACLLALVMGVVPLKSAEMHRDIEYGVADGESLKLDASVPDGTGPFPVAILVHGGGWRRGDKSGSSTPGDSADITPWFAPLTAAHFTWFSINYRLAPAHRWPACFEDVQTAIRWVKAHAAEYRGDPNRIVLFGHSAGGHLVCLAAVQADENTRVQAVVGCSAVVDFEQQHETRRDLSTSLQGLFGRPPELSDETRAIMRATSPINHVHAGLPPFLLIDGDLDQSVPYQQALNFQAKVRAAGGTCDLVTIKGAPHSMMGWAELDPGYPDQMIAWLRTHLPAMAPAN